MTLCPQAWDEAGVLLVRPEQLQRSAFAEAEGQPTSAPLDDLLARIDGVTTQVACGTTDPLDLSDPAGLPRLAMALLKRPWNDGERERLRAHADRRRQRSVGEVVTYVVNRNLNATNHCVLRCGFCAFRRDPGRDGAYRLTRPELQRRAADAQRRGATELCLQGGLDPEAHRRGSHLEHAVALLEDLRQAAPGIHLHAFSPQELLYIAQCDQVPLDGVLERLIEAGLGSVPGTAAEVLSDRVRRVICPEKLCARSWVTVMIQVHRSGLAATSTMMAGHLERPADRVAHLLTLLGVQLEARRRRQVGFSEFVLLPFVGASAPTPLRRRVGRDQPDPVSMLELTAQARLLLDPLIRHHQPSWVKLTLPVASEALRWGCDDLGGTLMEEHISTMAGARGGTGQTAGALAAAAARQGRPARQRTTLYGPVNPDRHRVAGLTVTA